MKTQSFIFSDTTFLLLSDLVHQKAGLFYPQTRRVNFEQRVLSRMNTLNLKNPEQYYQYLADHPQYFDEFLNLITLLTNNETFFFREENTLQAAAAYALEHYLQSEMDFVNILSAGSASGEELASSAMILHEKGAYLDQIHFTGIDIDINMLRLAKAGLYRPKSFRRTSPERLSQFFQPHKEEQLLDLSIHQRLNYLWANVIDPATLTFGQPFDIIFCRNVLIYFSDTMMQKVVENLYHLLKPHGILILGAAESIAHTSPLFEPIRQDSCVIYKKLTA